MANEHIFKSGVVVSGSIESTTGFVGDGSGLSGITSLTVWNGKLDGAASITGSLTVSSSTARVDFVDTAGVTGSFSGSFKGNGSELTNINIDGTTASNVILSGSFSGNGSGLTGLDTFPYYGDAKITGSLTISSSVVDFTDSTAISGSTFSGSFVGDGTGLSGLTASPAGANTEVQLNSSGTTGATSNLKYIVDTLFVSQSIQVSTSGSGALRITQDSNSPNISLLQARGSGGTNMGTFLFQGRTPYGTTSNYLTLSSAEVDAQTALIKGGRLSVGGYPTTTPSTAQGNLYVKRNTSSSGTGSDTVATFINTDSGAYGGGGFIDIIGNSNDFASGGIRVKNGTHTDGQIYYSAGSRTIFLESNIRTGSSSGGLQFKWQGSTKFYINAAGSVGIGTTIFTAPNYGTIPHLAVANVSGATLQLRNSTSNTLAGNTLGRIQFTSSYINSPFAAGNIRAIAANNASGGASGGAHILFETSTGVTAASPSERMRITSGGNVGIGTQSPSSSALLDVSSTTKGVLLPRMTTTQINAISNPAEGLTVFNTLLNTLCFYNGVAWRKVSDSNMNPLP